MAEFALKEIGRFCWLTLKEFDECRAQRGAEIGILVIPVADAKGLCGCQKLIDRSRRRGANLSVLVLAQTAQLAEDIILDDCFDAMICIKWASAAHLLRQNLKDHKRRLQNYAFKAFLDHSVDGYWIWDIENDDIE